jgi:hypothetical protein
MSERHLRPADPPLPADFEDLEDDDPPDPDAVLAAMPAEGLEDLAAAGAPVDGYDDADIAADTGATPAEVEAAVRAAQEEAGRSGMDRRYPQGSHDGG